MSLTLTYGDGETDGCSCACLLVDAYIQGRESRWASPDVAAEGMCGGGEYDCLWAVNERVRGEGGRHVGFLFFFFSFFFGPIYRNRKEEKGDWMVFGVWLWMN